jgi:hypothetical protein
VKPGEREFTGLSFRVHVFLTVVSALLLLWRLNRLNA